MVTKNAATVKHESSCNDVVCKFALSVINIRKYRRAVKNGQSRETGNIRYTRLRKTKQKHNTICVGHHYSQPITNT